ncbi:MAG TPA: methyltransferase domain-containing protein [Symbiobacteriaceae bacterium]|jgi:ubiquinone/menaquinone biosynthesis C-methylase UbiE|nr:methyltransferase domain-containing protein [Symbiobacteriaceae bacterium]
MGHKFNPAHADRLLDPARKEWNDPDKILQYMNLGQCTIMVDIGCGPGWFTLEAARKMQPGGLVYGVDVSEEMLAKLKERAKAEGLFNVQTVLAEEDDEYPIPTESADVLLIANVYHEVDPASNFMGEIKRILKPASTCLVVDWRTEQTPVGPPLEERVDQQDVVEEFYAAGFVLAGTCDVGPYHYGLKFYKIKDPQDPYEGRNNTVP